MSIKIDYGDNRGVKVYDKIEDLFFDNLVSRQINFNNLTKEYVEENNINLEGSYFADLYKK